MAVGTLNTPKSPNNETQPRFILASTQHKKIPQLKQEHPLNLSILIGGGKKTTVIPLVTASEQGKAQTENLV